MFKFDFIGYFIFGLVLVSHDFEQFIGKKI